MSLLGIDIGTSACKAAFYEADGRVLGSARIEYPTLHPGPGLAELDAPAVFEAVCRTVREAGARAEAQRPGILSSVDALCAGSMGEALVPLGRAGQDRRILGSSILGFDRRGAEYLPSYTAAMPPRELYAINPNIPAASYSMPKLCWIRDNLPDLYREADYFLSWADAFLFLAGCEPVSNFAHANRTLLFDIRTEDWSSPLLEATRLDGHKLGRTVAPGEALGPISPEAATRLGLACRPTGVVGAHDQCLNALGSAAVDAGDAVCGIGTVECITPVYDRIPDLQTMRAAGLNVEHHAVPGRYVSFLYNQAGLLVEWLKRTTGAASPTELFAELPTGPSGLLALPYFEPSGAPAFIDDASGVFVGLRPETGRGAMLKALLEAESFYFVEGLQALEGAGFGVTDLVASGGGANSDAWLQLKADILEIPVTRLEQTEAGTLGAALLAGTAAGVYADAGDAAKRLVTRGDEFIPVPANRQVYRRLKSLYRRLYPALRDIMRELDGATAQA